MIKLQQSEKLHTPSIYLSMVDIPFFCFGNIWLLMASNVGWVLFKTLVTPNWRTQKSYQGFYPCVLPCFFHSLLFYSDISPSKASLKAHKYFKVAFLVCWPSPWSNPAVARGAQVIPICDGMRIRAKRGSVQPVRYLLICFLVCNPLFFLLNQYVYIKGSVDKYSDIKRNYLDIRPVKHH